MGLAGALGSGMANLGRLGSLGTRSSYCAHGAAPRKGTFLNKLKKEKRKKEKQKIVVF